MGRRATGTVEPLRTSIRLKFTWRGSRCVETLDLEPTPANIKAAERLMGRVQAAIDAGVYEPANYFPKAGQQPTETFRDYAEEWLKSLTGAKSTKRSYRSGLTATWYPAIGDKRLSEVRHSDITKAIGEKASAASGKTINNALIPLREIFKVAMRHNVSRNKVHAILDDWMAGTKPTKAEIEREAAEAYRRLRGTVFLPSF